MRVKMGSACCVAAKDRTITNGSSNDVMPRNVRYSPSWSFRWDNRGRVAGEEMSMAWFSDGVGTNDRLENKSQTTVEHAYRSEEGSPLESFRKLTSHRSSPSEGNIGCLSVRSSPSEGNIGCQSDPSNSIILPQVKELREIPVALEPSPTTHSISSFSPSPMSSSRGHLRWPRRSPGHHLLRQVSDSRIPATRSRNFSISEEGSHGGGSSDGLSLPAFAELMANTHRERWSFDSEALGFNRDKISRSNGRISSSPSIDLRTCGACSKLLTEKSSWGTNELAVIAILICGHVYHAECLENMTPEINKYDPACPICSFGEKQTLKLQEKALRAEMNLKAKISKKSKSNLHEDGDPRMMSSSSSMKSSTGKPFLKRHFSFGSKGSRSLSEKNSSGKKGFFWSKSIKE